MNILKKQDALWETPHNQAFINIAVAVLIVSVLSINAIHWIGRDYRQDESIVIYETIDFSWHTNFQNLATLDVNPPMWWFISEGWIKLFGHLELITRFLPTLGTALTLALVFRLSADLFGRVTGVLAVFILGTSAFFQYYTHEYRPYFLLCGGVVALHFFFLRWLKRQNFAYALLYVFTAAALLYTHYYTFYVIASQAVVFVLFVRWNRITYLRAAGLLVAIGLSFVGWLLPFLHSILVTWPGGITWYGGPTNAFFLYLIVLITDLGPSPVGRVLLALSLLIPVLFMLTHRSSFLVRKGMMRGNEVSAWLYLWAVVATILLMAVSTNLVVRNITARNLIVVLPFMAILAASTIAILPRPLKWAAIPVLIIAGIIALPQFPTFQEFNTESGPYQQIIATIRPDYQPGARVIVDTGYLYKQASYLYYLHNRFPEDIPANHAFRIMDFAAMPGEAYGYNIVQQLLPELPVNFTGCLSDEVMTNFRTFIKGAGQIWYIRDMPTPFSPEFLKVLEEKYHIVEQIELDPDHVITEFEPIG